ncbi:(d)CMP kinase [Candidatus Daviesbacteria bacterium]|nr:(d)CMP kinase [Candidatus Daviesbacteria bacterium]
MEEIITIDGPTSSGKNSVGFLLAKKLGYIYIDTGMIYRAGAFKILQTGISLDDKEKILEIYKNLDVRFEMNRGWKMFLDGEDVTEALHTPEISEVTSKVSAIAEVRTIMKGIQRKLANGGIVMGGRDIGSEIFPESKHKFFLTASVEVRVKRRFEQLQKKDPAVKYEDVLASMMERDKRDSQREASPMRVPKGAVIIDNSNLTIEQTVDQMLKHINA